MWYNVPKAFSASYCAEIVNYFVNKPTISATVEGTGVDTNIRRADICFVKQIPGNDTFEANLQFSVDRLVQRVNAEWFGYDLGYNEAPQFGTYTAETKAFYDWHEDTLFQTGHKYTRKLSMVMLLNDKSEYEGGNLEMDHNDKPKNFAAAGDAVFFPSYLRHRVTPMQSGKRHSLVCWSNGPPWR